MATKRKARKTKNTRTKRGATRKKTARRKAKRRPATKRAPVQRLHGWITHTDIASTNPVATKAWAAKVLGWTFRPPMPMGNGADYHLFAYSDKGGGGIRVVEVSEVPHSIPYVYVANTRESFDRAIREGAKAVQPPNRVMEGVTIAEVRAPGGVVIGFSGP